MNKKGEWQNKNVNLKMLTETIKTFLRNDGFSELKISEDPSQTWFEIYARKAGALRTLGGSRKALHVIITGRPNNFKVTLALGEWGKNMAVAAAGAVFTMGILTAVGAAGMGLNARFQNKLWKFIESSVNSLLNSATNVPPINEQPMEPDKPFYEYHEQNYLSRPAQEGSTQINPNIDHKDDPLEILKMRLAKGEIDQKQYKQLLKILQSSQIHANSPPSAMPDSNETQFWSCPQCYGPIEIQDGKEYCRNCNKFMDS